MTERRDDLAARIASLSPEKRDLLERRLGSRSGDTSRVAEPVAVVGMACRFPGAENLDAFWTLIEAGGDAITEVPPDRWNAAEWYDSDPSSPGRIASRWGGFVPGIDQFDAAFFGISSREASQMDPQQRLLLEVAWNALEDAGETPASIPRNAGVFLGAHSHSVDYALLQYRSLRGLDAFSGTGTAHNLFSGRLSYFLDLHGPSLVVDTACSSSLVAVHLACQSLRSGECDAALVGGVNLLLTPHFSVAASRMHMLSPRGRCRPFDADADGFVRSDGCGVVVLKRLDRALASGNRVLAVLRGSAMNQDGRTNGVTAPNGHAQRAVIREALRQAGMAPSRVSYVETHGTGTPLGNPIEVESVAAVLGETSEAGGSPSCALGSVKANIGHAEGAAGIAGLIKTVLCLRHATIPPVALFTRLNPHLNLEGTRLRIPLRARSWDGPSPRVAGVSSFGWSGTNVHVVVEEAPARSRSAATTGATGRRGLLPLSAASGEALRALAGRYADWLESPNERDWADVCWSAGRRRAHLAQRVIVAAASGDEAAASLRAFQSGATNPCIVSGRASVGRPSVVFVFPGQGGQWLGMGREMYEGESTFRAAFDRCDATVSAIVGWSPVRELLAGAEASQLKRIDVVQPVLFAIQVALTEQWRSQGVEPDAVVGHSMGEPAAALAAGILDLDAAPRSSPRAAG